MVAPQDLVLDEMNEQQACHRYLYGVQGVAGSNPAARTNSLFRHADLTFSR